MRDCKVLVVEDDQDTREALVDLLRHDGYEAESAADGQAALSLLRSGRFEPDVIVLDLYMPTMDGREFRAALQADPEWARIPVILCSGTTPLASGGLEVFGALEKPMDLDALLAVVQRGCAARKPDRALSA